MSSAGLSSNHRFWPPRFSLRALMLAVLAVAVGLAGFGAWRRVRDARVARAEFDRLSAAWSAGVLRTTELIDGAERVFEAERRQWFSSHFERAIIESHILRLKWVQSFYGPHSDVGMGAKTEEEWIAARKPGEDVGRRIDELEMLLNSDGR